MIVDRLRCRQMCASALGAILTVTLLATLARTCAAQANPFPGEGASVLGWTETTVFNADFEQSVPFPAMTSTVNPESSFAMRAATVLEYNACGREMDYAAIRAEMSLNSPNYSHEGAELTSILIAKIVWLTNPKTARTPCSHSWIFHVGGRSEDPNAIGRVLAHANTTFPRYCDDFEFPTGTPEPYIVKVTVSPSCMKQQVNVAVKAMQKWGQLGTSVTCLTPLPQDIQGEWDQNNRNLVRILYLGQVHPQQQGSSLLPVLDADTISYMYSAKSGPLLAAQGDVGPDYYNLFTDCTNQAGDATVSPEDAADQSNFVHTVENDLGDLFKWFIDLMVKTYAGDVLAAVSPALYYVPFLVEPGDDPWGQIVPSMELDLPETENHRLQIETSRFLTNADLIQYAREGGSMSGQLAQQQTGVINWLLKDLQRIASTDFQEYNARPYTEYSLDSLANLYDLTPVDDSQSAHSGLRDAAHIVLDLSEAKFAVGSNRGRRMAPFRRREVHDGYQSGVDVDCQDGPSHLYNDVCGADDEVVRAMQLSGQVQLIDQSGPGVRCSPSETCISASSIPSLVYPAIGKYRIPDFILDVIVNRSTVSQRIKHDGIESYFMSPSFTATAGGIQTPATQKVMGVSSCDIPFLSKLGCSAGVAMPTSIIPTMEGWTVDDVFSFNGVGVGIGRTENLCMFRGFICGIQPNIQALTPPYVPNYFAYCTNIETVPSQPGTYLFFVNSKSCATNAPGPYFYLAAKIAQCDGSFCDSGKSYGIMEAVEAPQTQIPAGKSDPDFAAFQTSRRHAMTRAVADGSGNAKYTSASGQVIDFSLKQSRPEIVAIDGTPSPPAATDGDVITSDGKGHATINRPFSGQMISIDFSNWHLPQWTPNY